MQLHDMASKIYENIEDIKNRIVMAAQRTGRKPEDITILPVTKGINPSRVKDAIASGMHIFGENYVQEAITKIAEIDMPISWHFIGHLQKNKVRTAVRHFDMIQSLDSAELANEINKRTNKRIEVLIQVNISGERTKNGVDKKNAITIARKISSLGNIRFKGLMTIPPQHNDPNRSRPCFAGLRRLADEINDMRIPNIVVDTLSMGMSNDFEVAVEEGATMVRIGTAIFGERI